MIMLLHFTPQQDLEPESNF